MRSLKNETSQRRGSIIWMGCESIRFITLVEVFYVADNYLRDIRQK